MRSEFKNLFENHLNSTSAAGKSAIDGKVANPPYFAWSTSGDDSIDEENDENKALSIKSKAKVVQPSPVSTDPNVGSNEWVSEYDATTSSVPTITTDTRIAGVQTNKNGVEPSNFAYPVMEVKAPDVIHPPLGYSVSYRDIPGPTSEYRTSYNWEGKDIKMIKNVQPYSLTPMGLDNTLLNACEWISEYDNKYIEPPTTSLGGMTITSTGSATKPTKTQVNEWVLPAPAGIAKKTIKGKKVYNKTYTNVTPYAVNKTLNSPKSSVYDADYSQPTTRVPHFAGSPTRNQEVLSGAASLVRGRHQPVPFHMVDTDKDEVDPVVPVARETIHVKFNTDSGSEAEANSTDYSMVFEDEMGSIGDDIGVEMINLNPDASSNEIEYNNDDVNANISTKTDAINTNTINVNNIFTGPYVDHEEDMVSMSYKNIADISVRDIINGIPIHGKTTPLEPPLWVNGGSIPATIFRPSSPSNKGKYINNFDKNGKNLSNNDDYAFEDSLPVPPPIVLPPFAVDIRLVGDAQFPLPKQKVVGRKPNDQELKRIFEIIKKHEEKKKTLNESNRGSKGNNKTNKNYAMKKYKNYTGPNRAIKGAPRYGTDGARAARVASNRAYKENKKSLNNTVLSNPRYPILSEKQANRWGTVSKTSFKKKGKSSYSNKSNTKNNISTI